MAQAVIQAQGIKLALMSTEKCPSITAQLKIDSVPCLMTFVGGKVVDKSPGGMPSLDLASQYVAKMVDLGATTAATNTMIQAGKLLAEGKVEEALQQYMAVLQMSKVKHGAVAHVNSIPSFPPSSPSPGPISPLVSNQKRDVYRRRGITSQLTCPLLCRLNVAFWGAWVFGRPAWRCAR